MPQLTELELLEHIDPQRNKISQPSGTQKGDKILDTHVGSASSLIACYDMGFDYIGFELDKEYFDLATKRLENHKKQMRLFADENSSLF